MRPPLWHQTVQHVDPNTVHVCSNNRREGGVLPGDVRNLSLHIASLVGLMEHSWATSTQAQGG